MKSKILIAAVAALLCSPAFATNNGNGNSPASADQEQAQGQAQGQLQGQSQGNFNAVGVENDVRNTANSASISGADSHSTSSSGAVSGSVSGALSSSLQSQDATANNEGNSQSITLNSPDSVTYHQRGTANLRTVPTAIAPNIYPTASCAMSASAGASTLGTGISFGGTKVNHECVKLETARVFSQLGYPVQGLDVLCSTKVSLEVFGTKEACLAGGDLHEAQPDPSVVVVPVGVSQRDVTDQIDRAFKASVSK